MTQTTEELVTASYTIPASVKERIDRMAVQQDLNASQVVRRILREHFERLDAEAEKRNNGKVAARP